MANNCLFTTILIVVSSSVNCERRAFLQRTNNFQEAIPHNWKHDQEELNRNMVKNAGQPWGKLRTGPRPAPLRPNPPNQWPLGIHQNVLTDKEDTQYRVQQLQNKLMPSQNNILPIRTLNQPHPKPDIEVKLHKREGAQLEKVVRKKRDVIINPMIRPELALQPHIQPAILQEKEVKYDEKDTTEKRDKRQIMFVIKQRPLEFGKKPRTTPNPFIRETNIADYDIVKTEVDKPEIDVIETVDTDSYQLGKLQSLFQYLQSLIFRNPTESIPMSKAEYVNEELHIRVKRRMSKFRRDRKQMTRKRKIGRRKKTKVRRAPIKLKKWYDKRQKTRKKGDGTYRGGRGRKPRQHKRPRNYKPPQNETSDYDYYDEDGNLKEPSGETQEGSDDAAYVSYGTGEYADTAEAEAAQQELEKEYQMQLVRERKRAERRRLSNGTIESTEEILSLPLIESKEDLSNTTKDGNEEDDEEYYDDDEEEENSQYENDESSDSSSNSGGGGKTNKGKDTKHVDGKLKNTNKKPSNTKQASHKVLGYSKLHNVEQEINRKVPNNFKYPEKINIQSNVNKNFDLETKNKLSQSIRQVAKKFNFMSQSVIPGFRNSLQPNQPSNGMYSAKFKIAQDRLFKNLQSMPKKKTPDVNSITNMGLSSTGGKKLQSLQSKKVYRIIESKSHDEKLKLTSTAGHKTDNTQIFTSQTEDRRKKFTSLGNSGLKRFQSLALDPLVLTSIANHVPDLEIDTTEVKDPKSVKVKTDTKPSAGSPIEIDESKTVNNHEKTSVLIKRDTTCNKINNNNSKNGIKNSKLKMKSYTYEEEEESIVPDKDLGISVPSDEVESAPDDETKTKH